MFLNSWSIALCIISLLSLFLISIAARTGYRVLRFWNPASDADLQIRLEGETWLASTLVAYALGFQIVSLMVFVLAADNYCQVIAGAMCATGSLMANGFGLPALAMKIGGIFIYGFWLVLHRLDIGCETYPLVRLKYFYLLFILPFLAADVFFQTAYIAGLEPDIITSCCAVVFSSAKQSSSNLLDGFSQPVLLALFYGNAFCLFGLKPFFSRYRNRTLAFISGFFWCCFFAISLLAITTVFSSYVYAMPYHKCPFCILKPEYNYFGFLLYGFLLPTIFFGISASIVSFLPNKLELLPVVDTFQRQAMFISTFMLVIFTILSSYHYFLYNISGGQV